MDKKELAKLIHDRVAIIGTDIKHLESIAKYAQQDKQFAEAFSILFLSLQNTIYIELFKLFDGSGEDAKNHNIYTLINYIENGKQTYHKMISPYTNDIQSIKNRRNHLYGHELGKDGADIYADNPINHLQDLLKVITKICCVANDTLYPNTYCRNADEFDKWCYMSLEAIKEVCNLHDKQNMKMSDLCKNDP